MAECSDVTLAIIGPAALDSFQHVDLQEMNEISGAVYTAFAPLG